MAIWRVLLNVSLADLPLNGVTGIDASGFEWTYASTRYTKRTNLTIQQLKTTLLVDTATNAVLDIYVTATGQAGADGERCVSRKSSWSSTTSSNASRNPSKCPMG